MAEDILNDDFESKSEKKTKKRGKKKATKKTSVKKATSKSSGSKPGNDSNLFVLIVAAVIILGIIGILFGYTKDKITEISKGKEEVSRTLEGQISDLKDEIASLKDKAANLEKESDFNKEVVIDLFDKNRQIPRKIDVLDWNILDNKELSFTVSYPKSWETIKPIINVKTVNEKEQVEEILYLQPVGVPNFINAVTIKTDYSDFAELTLQEKKDIFIELDSIDTYEYEDGVMIYFINLDKNNNEVPTVLILTEESIYRATFNVVDKTLENYFSYREDFEKIIATFGKMMPADLDEEIEE